MRKLAFVLILISSLFSFDISLYIDETNTENVLRDNGIWSIPQDSSWEDADNIHTRNDSVFVIYSINDFLLISTLRLVTIDSSGIELQNGDDFSLDYAMDLFFNVKINSASLNTLFLNQDVNNVTIFIIYSMSDGEFIRIAEMKFFRNSILNRIPYQYEYIANNFNNLGEIKTAFFLANLADDVDFHFDYWKNLNYRNDIYLEKK